MNSNFRSGLRLSYLLPVSLGYLAIPYLLFFAGWLKWYMAIFCIGMVVLPLLSCLREITRSVSLKQDWKNELNVNGVNIILMIVVALLFLGVSGVGGYGFQDTDWIKHNAILKDLITQPWPVDYQMGGQKVPLVYYIAYYLPAALVGKLGGWSLANHVLFIWSLIGLVLAILWFLVLNRRFVFTVILLFVLFSGIDVLGEIISSTVVAAIRPEVRSILTWNHIEGWSIGWQYSSNATLLFWVPHQALAGWIACGMLVSGILNAQQRKYDLLIIGLTTLWSPFITIGLLPFLLAGFLLEDGNLAKRLQQYLSLPNLCGLLVALVVGLFYSAKLYEISLFPAAEIPGGFSLAFAPDSQARLIGLALMLLFCFLEFGLYGLFIWVLKPEWDRKTRVLFATTLICLSLIPLYRFGGVNDFVMRASIPALFVLAVFVGRALHDQSSHRLAHIFLIVLVLLGSVTVGIEFRRHLVGMVEAGKIMQVPRIDQVMSVSEWGVYTDKDATIVLQYIGSSKAPFFEFLAKGP